MYLLVNYFLLSCYTPLCSYTTFCFSIITWWTQWIFCENWESKLYLMMACTWKHVYFCCVFLSSLDLLMCIISSSSCFMKQGKQAYWVDHLSVSFLTWVLGSLKILSGHSSFILEFTLLFSAARSVRVLAVMLVVITDALCDCKCWAWKDWRREPLGLW